MHLLEVLKHGSLLPVSLRFYSVLGISTVVEKLPERCWGSVDEAGHLFSCLLSWSIVSLAMEWLSGF